MRRTGLRRARLCSSRLRSRLPRLRSARVWRLWLCSLRGLRLRNVLDVDALGLDPVLLTETATGLKSSPYRPRPDHAGAMLDPEPVARAVLG